MRDASDMKGWYREDIARVLVGVNAASRAAGRSDEFRAGFVAALVSVGLVIGVKPESILLPEDAHRG